MVGYHLSSCAPLNILLHSLRCPVVAHWRCLASTQRDEILKAARDKDREEWQRSQTETAQDPSEAPAKRPGLDINQTTEFICGANLKALRLYCHCP